KGHEYGATTGRPRRTGWLDIPALKYAIMLSGVDELIMMKADVLTGMELVHAATSYEGCEDDEQCPFKVQGTTVKPEYKSFPGWEEDISVMRQYEQLPSSFKDYIRFTEQAAGVPIRIISVGPDREQTIHMP